MPYQKPQIDEHDFIESVNQAITKGRHVDYLENVLADYRVYKKFFSDEAFTDHNPRGYIYKFKIKYRNQKGISRVIEAKGNNNFEELAEAIIESMGWQNDHLHQFGFPEHSSKFNKYSAPKFYILSYAEDLDDDPHPVLKTKQVRVDDIDWDKFPHLYFEFDFGDSHEFDIKLLGIRGPKMREVKPSFPRLLKSTGRAPEQYPKYDDNVEEDEEFEDPQDDEAFMQFRDFMQNGNLEFKEYFDFHDKLPKKITSSDVKRAISILGSADEDEALVKYSIFVLGHAGTAESLEALEKFSGKADAKYIFFLQNAIGECRMFLHSKPR